MGLPNKRPRSTPVAVTDNQRITPAAVAMASASGPDAAQGDRGNER